MHPVVSYYTDISRCTVDKTLNKLDSVRSQCHIWECFPLDLRCEIGNRQIDRKFSFWIRTSAALRLVSTEWNWSRCDHYLCDDRICNLWWILGRTRWNS